MRFVLPLALILLFSCSPESDIIPISEELPDDVEVLTSMLDDASNDDEKLNIYWKLYNELKYTNPKLTAKYLEQMEVLAEEEENSDFIGLAYHGKGFLDKRDNRPQAAIRNYLTAISYFENSSNNQIAGPTINNIGVVFLNNGDYDYAIAYFEKVKDIYKDSGDNVKLIIANINLGLCHSKKPEPDYRLAGKYYDEAIALNIEESKSQNHYYSRLYNLKGNLYNTTKRYSRAVANYRQALEYLPEDKAGKRAMVYYNIGEALIGNKEYAEAKVWLDKSQKLEKEADLGEDIMTECYNIFGKLYQSQGEHEVAIGYFEKAISIANKEVSNEYLQRALQLIRTSQRVLQQEKKYIDPAKLLYYADISDRQIKLHDEIFKEAGSSSLQAALRKEVEISKLENKLNASMISKKRTIIYAGILVGIFLLLSLWLLFWKVKIVVKKVH